MSTPEPLLVIDLSTLKVGDEVEVTTDQGHPYRLTVVHPNQGWVKIAGRPIYTCPELRFILDNRRRPVIRRDTPLQSFVARNSSIPINIGTITELVVNPLVRPSRNHQS